MNYQEVSLLALFLLEQVINDNIAFITNHVGDEKCNQEGCFALVTDYDELDNLPKWIAENTKIDYNGKIE